MKKIFFLSLIIFSFHNIYAWGFKAHKLINEKAIFFLPDSLFVFYKKYHTYIKEHSVDPDKRKRFQKDEKFKHFINVDLYEDFPFHRFPKTYKDALKKYLKEELQQSGILPWHIEKVLLQLTKAFQQKNGDKILKLSADLGHYIADASVPLHVTKNYNGQLSNQEGVHSLWETQCIQLLEIDTLRVTILPIQYISNVNQRIWAIILSSYSNISYILESEKKIASTFLEFEKYKTNISSKNPKKAYSKPFAREFLKANKNNIIERLNYAAHQLSNFYYTAWVNAGKPDLSSVLAKSTKISIRYDENNNDLEHE